jgi:predicted amidophosphoribosyltransferase
VDRCVECVGRLLSFRSARGAVAYEGAARRLVAGWKERGLRRLAEAAADLVAGVVPCPSADVVTFVPGDAARTLWRGQNTAEALAVCLGRRWELPVEPLLARTGPARRQRGLDRRLRRANVRGRFRARTDAPSTVVLVDDVYTTGATAGAAATELRRAGARAVDVITFARVVRR